MAVGIVSAASSVSPKMNLLVKRLSENARLPTRGSALAAGYDLYRCVAQVHAI